MIEISIIGPTISGNKGAESMFQSAIQNISEAYPKAKFNLFTYYPKQDRVINKNKNVKILSGTPINLALIITPLATIYSILKFFNLPTSFLERNGDISTLLKSDLVIDMGGITFVDGREKYLPFNILCVLPPLLLKKKVMKYSQAMGPFNNHLNLFFAKSILPKIDLIVARGETTKKNLETLNIDNVAIAADAAFSMNVSKEAHSVTKEYLRDDLLNQNVLGIAPSSVVGSYCKKNDRDYPKIMAEFINHIIEKKGFNVIIIPHSIRRYTRKKKNNDLVVSREIHNLVKNKSSCILISDELTAEELRVLISHCNFFIASRFHAMVSSLSMKVPTLVCGWSHKYLEVLRMFQLEDYAFDYTNLSLNTLIGKFDEMIEQEGEIRDKLENFLPEVIASSKKNAELAKNLLAV